MNLLQRLARRLRAIMAAIRGLEPAPLPPTVVDPRIPVETLTKRAEARGTADARAFMYDGWSFGRPTDPESDQFDPSFVRQLGREREAAVASIQARQSITTSRVSHVTRWRNETESMMDFARRRMSGIAAREARLDATRVRESQTRAGVDVTAEVPRVEVPDESVWEGETQALGYWWRAVILLGLMAVELPVQFVVYDYFLGGSSSWTGLGGLLTLSTSAAMVLGPFVAGLLVRGRQATGAPRYAAFIVLALALPWLYLVAILGLLQARRFDLDGSGGSRIARLNLTPLTVIMMFVAILLVVGTMAHLLGLARNHPFQQAYVRSRRRRDRMDTLRREMVDRINPAYRDPDTQASGETDPDERAVIEAYGAAEEAYFEALTRAMGEPPFTEAVERRRGPRPNPAAQPSVPVAPSPPTQSESRDNDAAEADEPLGPQPGNEFPDEAVVDRDDIPDARNSDGATVADPPNQSFDAADGTDSGSVDGREVRVDITLPDDDPERPDPTIVDRPPSGR